MSAGPTSRRSSVNNQRPGVQLNILERQLARLFRLTYPDGANRLRLVVISFVVVWFFIAFQHRPWGEWLDALAYSLLEGLFQMDFLESFDVLGLFINSLFNPTTLAHLIALFVPAFVAWRVASAYLADIFELKDPDIAGQYLSKAAFSYPTYDLIHIQEGDVQEQDKVSPVYLIGGPGRVQVHLENAAIFERVDGSFDVVGPTTGGVRVLEGFERIRSVIDLRDQVMAFDVTARSKDGVKITLKNVRLLFSVYRGRHYPTLTQPYPYNRQALENLVTQQSYPTGGETDWTTTMTGMVRGQLAQFIEGRPLGEILAAVGEPEVAQQIEMDAAMYWQLWRRRRHNRRYHSPHWRVTRARSLGRRKVRVALIYTTRKHARRARYPLTFNPRMVRQETPPNATTRVKLTNFFKGFEGDFPHRANQRGVSLSWVDVGSWEIPTPAITKQYLEAWELTSENLKRSAPKVIQQLGKQAHEAEFAQRLQDLVDQAAWSGLERRVGRKELATSLMHSLYGTLRAAQQGLLDENKSAPQWLAEAIERLDKVVKP